MRERIDLIGSNRRSLTPWSAALITVPNMKCTVLF